MKKPQKPSDKPRTSTTHAQGSTTTQTARRASAFSTIKKWAQLVQNLTIIFGVVTAIVSLFYSQYDRRVTRTLEFSKEYIASIRKENLGLLVAWNKYADGIPNYEKLPLGDKRALVVKFLNSNDAAQEQFYNVLDFYDTLYVCVKNRTCDRNAALEFFGKSADETYEIFSAFIRERRKIENSDTIGFGLEQFFRLTPEYALSRYF